MYILTKGKKNLTRNSDKYKILKKNLNRKLCNTIFRECLILNYESLDSTTVVLLDGRTKNYNLILNKLFMLFQVPLPELPSGRTFHTQPV